MGIARMAAAMRTGLVLLMVLGFSLAKNDNVFSRLIDDLFADSGYEKDAIPMLKAADKDSNINAIDVGVGISIIDMDYDPSNILTANTWFKATWQDYRLKWDPEQYGGIQNLKIPAYKLWIPDLSVYNSADYGAGSFYDRWANNPTNAIVYHTGKVLFIPPLPMKVHCQNERVAQNHSPDSNDALETKYYDCCVEPYMSMNYVFTIQKAFDIVDGKKVFNKTPEDLDALFKMYKVTFTHD